MKKRLLFAAVDVGYRIENFTKFLTKNFSGKILTESFVKYQAPNSHYKTHYDYVIDYYKTNRFYRSSAYFLFFIKGLFRYDIYYFISGETILSRKLRRFELATYKFFGKRVVFNFVGADIRSVDYLIWKQEHIFEYLEGKSAPPKSEEFQKELIEDALRYGDEILVSTPDMLELIPHRKEKSQAKFLPVIFDVESLAREIDETEELEKEPNKIYILHSPSNTSTKGTAIVEAVLEKIQKEFPDSVKVILPHKESKYELRHSTSRYELFQLLKQSDIVIDQMIIGWYGMQSVEAIIAGKKVICYIEKKLEKYLFKDCPIVVADASNLENNLRKCLIEYQKGNMPDKQKQLDWVKENHSMESNREMLITSIGV